MLDGNIPAGRVPVRIGQAGRQNGKSAIQPSRKEAANPFQNALQEKLIEGSKVRFSAHAIKRLQQRRIMLDQKSISCLEQAVERARAKGARDSLVLLEDLVLIVSVENRTVVTAVDGARVKNSVFTNIDSAVIT